MFRIEEQVIEIPVKFCFFWETPTCDTMKLEQSIRRKGIITPVIAREYEGRYQVCLGQRRLKAAINVGVERIPVLVRDLQDNEICILRIEDAVVHEGIKEQPPSRLAGMVAQYYRSIKSQGKRTDLLQEVRDFLSTSNELTSRPLGGKLDSGKATGCLFGIGSRSVDRLLRIDALCNELKAALDCQLIGIRAAVEFSYLDQRIQEAIGERIIEKKIHVSVAASKLARGLGSHVIVDYGLIMESLSIKKLRKLTFTDVLKKHGFIGLTQDESLSLIDKALEFYTMPR